VSEPAGFTITAGEAPGGGNVRRRSPLEWSMNLLDNIIFLAETVFPPWLVLLLAYLSIPLLALAVMVILPIELIWWWINH
jgi:hypothetical protein